MWRLNLFNYLQWEQTVYWYALSIFIIRQNALFVKAFFAENYRLTFFAKCGILDFEGIPETVGGLNFLLLPLPLLNLQQLGGDRYDGSIHHFR